jgi:hypothetical protein
MGGLLVLNAYTTFRIMPQKRKAAKAFHSCPAPVRDLAAD